MLEDAHRQGRRLRLLLQLGPEYEGFTAGAVWGKTEAWLDNPDLLHEIEGYALVSDIPRVREVIGVAGFLVPFTSATLSPGRASRRPAGRWPGPDCAARPATDPTRSPNPRPGGSAVSDAPVPVPGPTPEPPPITTDAGPFLVVGVDGSEGSARALRHAVDEAARRGWAVHVASAYDAAEVWATIFDEHVDVRAVHHRTKETADVVVAAVRHDREAAGEPVPPMSVTVFSGPAAVVLTRLSQHAEMLVVGHRGLGGLSSRFLGSVGLNCVVHAACTVTVVR